MSRYKYLEIRDRATCIPVIAIQCKRLQDDPVANNYMMKSGFGSDSSEILIVELVRFEANYNPFNWSNTSRTMREAHIFIENNYDRLTSGEVVDVEYILGESEIKKLPEIYTTDSADPLSEEIIKAMFRIAEGINNK